MQTHLRGALADGVIANDSNVALHELSLNFEYDQQANTLDFSEIQGTLLVGDPERVEEYTLIGEKIHFSDYVKNEATFDIWLGDKKRDVIRLSGQTFSSGAFPGFNCGNLSLIKIYHTSATSILRPFI